MEGLLGGERERALGSALGGIFEKLIRANSIYSIYGRVQYIYIYIYITLNPKPSTLNSKLSLSYFEMTPSLSHHAHFPTNENIDDRNCHGRHKALQPTNEAG